MQIAAAIANAQLYASLKKAEQELKESEQRYRELSIIDDLTQLYNSRHFYFQLKIELDRSNRYEQPLTLLLLDLDNFKAFNDAYGHVEGDHVLRRLGQVVKRCLRETDFACRYGGEEFTIILPMSTSADGAVTAERVRTEFKKETFSPKPGQDVHVTMSIGLVQYKTQEDMKAIIHRVDQLMYQGKKNGKDRVCSEL
jgi:two-component system cell cycle response regulator